ncbi:CPBP family intramembrane glutamic endopeptidase [Spiroplasma endosymbiont of Panorpa germanica]|uniref:CPBP family intramembrane glutamic endopeptidase n=1 Tax=Spiroplasma endosymbiont of Panorpa germanica TaxID=3066314 RepID=UPI0030D273E1
MQKEEVKIDSEEIKVTKIKTDKKVWEKVQIPSRWVDGNFPFNFYTYMDKQIGIIFLITGLVIPFSTALLIKLLFSINSDFSNDLSLLNLAVGIVSNGVGFFIIWDKRRSLMFKTTLFFYYVYAVMPIAISLLLSPISLLKIPEYWISSILLIFQSIIFLTLAYWVFNRVSDLRSRFAKTIKQNWKMVLIVTLIGAVTIFALSFLYGLLSQALNLGPGNSNNQNQLADPLTTGVLGSKILYAISLFVFTVIAAPLIEEIVFRDAIFVGTSNRWMGWIMSTILFGYIHISSTGDFVHLFQYLIAGFVLATAFNVCRGNVTYTWAIHVGSNLLSFIILLVSSYAVN